MPTPEVTIVNDVTTRINNILDDAMDLVADTSALLDSLNVTDFVHDPEENEYHAVSIEADRRWDAVDSAHNGLLIARLALMRAFNLSVNIDHK